MKSCFVLFVVILIALVTLFYFYKQPVSRENFVDVTNTKLEGIIRAYNEILSRDPSVSELKSAIDDIRSKRSNMYRLKMALINSDEYRRYEKTQTNSASPDLVRILAEDEYLKRVKQIYMDVFKKKIDHNLVLPYNDMYVHLFNSSDDKLAVMFRNERYPRFEEDVLQTLKLDLDREKLFALYEKTFSKNAIKNTEEPKPMYIVKEDTLASDAQMWIPSDEDVGRTIQTPWRSATQEEVTYKRFVPEGVQFVLSNPISLTEPIIPPFKTKPPVVVGQLPIPKPPLQKELVGASLSTNPLTLPTPEYVMPLDSLRM